MNAENYKLVLDTIKARPEQWDQRSWHQTKPGCLTKHCFAGWAQLLFLGSEKDACAREHAMEFLDLDEMDAEYLFSTWRTIQDFENFYAKHAPEAELCATSS